MLLVILQNAWRKSGEEFTREQWLDALWASHTGKRLKEMLPDCKYVVINASKSVGANSSSYYPAEPAHIKECIEKYKPTHILACGKVATSGCEMLSLPHISVPHPAYRALSKEITSTIRARLSAILC